MSVVYNGQLHLFATKLFTTNPIVSGLRHEWWDGTRWNFETLDGAGSTGHDTYPVGLYNTVTVFNGQLHVFTEESDTSNLPLNLRHDWWG